MAQLTAQHAKAISDACSLSPATEGRVLRMIAQIDEHIVSAAEVEGVYSLDIEKALPTKRPRGIMYTYLVKHYQSKGFAMQNGIIDWSEPVKSD